MGGTLTWSRAERLDPSTHFGAGTDRIGTLETARCWVLRDRSTSTDGTGPRILMVSAAAGATGYRPYVENYTVDASILEIHRKVCFTNDDQDRSAALLEACELRTTIIGQSPSFGMAIDSNSCVINFLRADGGCLGIWSRRRTYESAISLGELITEL